MVALGPIASIWTSFLASNRSYIPNMTHNDGSKVLEQYERIAAKEYNILKIGWKGESHNQ
jgi:hypothetical protein